MNHSSRPAETIGYALLVGASPRRELVVSPMHDATGLSATAGRPIAVPRPYRRHAGSKVSHVVFKSDLSLLISPTFRQALVDAGADGWGTYPVDLDAGLDALAGYAA